MDAVISVHDVMPDTLSNVQAILDILDPIMSRGPDGAICLLVIPGKPWSDEEINTLRNWQSQGYQLAAHGWHHQCQSIDNLYHRLHSILISRDVAEHLSLDEDELVELMQRSHAWFKANNLTPPQMYVPPAWALGKLSPSHMRRLPFSQYEVTSGFHSSTGAKVARFPLVGFEADTRLRKYLLRLFNNINKAMARFHGPLRISIHPFDLHYHLQGDLLTLLNRVDKPVLPTSLISDSHPER